MIKKKQLFIFFCNAFKNYL